jgi:hypothetical protein
MSDDGPVAQAQAALGGIAYQLLTLQERLVTINRSLPVPSNQEAMLEGETCPDVATEVSGCIECVTDDLLRQLVEVVLHAATVTTADLLRDFRERQRRRRRLEGH